MAGAAEDPRQGRRRRALPQRRRSQDAVRRAAAARANHQAAAEAFGWKITAAQSLRLRPVARNPFFMLGQVVLNRPPGRARRRKYVQARPNLGIVVEQTGGDADRLQMTCLAWSQAAADLATIAETAGRGFIAHGHVLACRKSELCQLRRERMLRMPHR